MGKSGIPSTQKGTGRKVAAPCWVLRKSPVHGFGLFAARNISPGTCIIEYEGERIDWAEAERRAAQAGTPVNHTYYFSLHDGRVIDGGSKGNEARFINHACEPNCEAFEHEDGRVFIYAIQPIEKGEELHYSYALIYDGRHTKKIREAFACHCGTPGCTGTYLAPKRR
jgi:hypothetical protein